MKAPVCTYLERFFFVRLPAAFSLKVSEVSVRPGTLALGNVRFSVDLVLFLRARTRFSS